MIPEAAVEAAAKWLHDIDCRSAIHSGHPADFECYDWLDEARELLGTIAPHMPAVVSAKHERIDPKCAKWREPRTMIARWLDIRGRGKWCQICRAAK